MAIFFASICMGLACKCMGFVRTCVGFVQYSRGISVRFVWKLCKLCAVFVPDVHGICVGLLDLHWQSISKKKFIFSRRFFSRWFRLKLAEIWRRYQKVEGEKCRARTASNKPPITQVPRTSHASSTQIPHKFYTNSTQIPHKFHNSQTKSAQSHTNSA